MTPNDRHAVMGEVDPIIKGRCCDGCGGEVRLCTTVEWDDASRRYVARPSPAVVIYRRLPDGKIAYDADGEPMTEAIWDCYCKRCCALKQSAILPMFKI